MYTSASACCNSTGAAAVAAGGESSCQEGSTDTTHTCTLYTQKPYSSINIHARTHIHTRRLPDSEMGICERTSFHTLRRVDCLEGQHLAPTGHWERGLREEHDLTQFY